MSGVVRDRGRLLIAAVLFPLGCFAAFVGGSDAFGARLMEYKILGALLFGIGVLIAGCVGVTLGGKTGLRLALVASALGSYVGLNLLLVQLAGLEHDARLVLWLLLLAAPLICVVVLWRADVRTSLPRQLGAILSAGLIFSVGQFWYTAQYVPSAIAPSLNVSAVLEKVGESSSQLALAATIGVENASTTRVRILGSMYRVTGIRRCALDGRTDAAGFVDELARAAADNRPASRFAHERLAEVVMADKVVMLPDGGWLEPGEEMARRFIVTVTRVPAYDIVRLETVFFLGKGNQLEIETVRGPRAGPLQQSVDGQTFVETDWRISDLSLLGRLTRGEVRIGELSVGGQRILLTRWYIGGDRPASLYPYLSVYIDREGRAAGRPPLDDYNLSMERFYGLAAATASSELSLWPPSAPLSLPSQVAESIPAAPVPLPGACPATP